MRPYQRQRRSAPAPAKPSASRFSSPSVVQPKTEATELPEWEQASSYDLDILNLNSAPIQAKLTVGEPNDQYEQEADRVAAEVVQRMNEPESVQREDLGDEELQMKPEAIQRETMPEEEEKLQAKFTIGEPKDRYAQEADQVAAEVVQREDLGDAELQMKPQLQRQGVSGAVSPELEQSLNRAKSGGQALDPQVQTKMGQAMGADFSGVKVHTDSQADQLNQSIQAKAFTTGQDVFFRQGEYNPGSSSGQELIAHELTHVVQQNGNTLHRKVNLNPLVHQNADHNQIQRLAWQNTNWNGVSDADVSTGGATGVIYVSDGTNDPPLVVKPGVPGDAAIVYAAIHNKVLKGSKASAPSIRAAGGNEVTALVNKLESNGFNWQNEDDNSRKKKLLTALETQNTMAVMTQAEGDQIDTIITGAQAEEGKGKHTKSKGNKRVVRDSSIFTTLTKSANLKALGKLAIGDIFTGNFDRILGMANPQNLLFDVTGGKFGVIDNVQSRDTALFQQNNASWQNNNHVNQLKEGKFDELAATVWENVFNNSLGDFALDAGQEGNQIRAALQGKRKDGIKNIKAGLKSGADKLKQTIKNAQARSGLVANQGLTNEGEAQLILKERYEYLFE